MTATMDIQEGNKLIAEFMGYYLFPSEYTWNDIMPVVEKISKYEYDREEQELPFGGTETIIHTAYPRTFGMLSNEGKPMVRFNRCGLFIADTLIEAAWQAVIQFIQWYNKEHK